MNNIQLDRIRYKTGRLPHFQYWFRAAQNTSGIIRFLCKRIYLYYSRFMHIEIPTSTKMGGGLYFGHFYNITINPHTVIGKNVNIHKGVTIGQENRGKRKGAPIIGNEVWIGVNSTIVGKITIGDDVLIAPNTYVNCDIPSHSIVFGNPCIIKPCNYATKDYICRKITINNKTD